MGIEMIGPDLQNSVVAGDCLLGSGDLLQDDAAPIKRVQESRIDGDSLVATRKGFIRTPKVFVCLCAAVIGDHAPRIERYGSIEASEGGLELTELFQREAAIAMSA